MRYLFLVLVVAAPASAWPWPEPRRDLHGDPLPAGAVQRLGMARYRFPGAVFQFTPDGKSIVAVSWGRYVSRLDAKTGRVMEQFTLPVDDARAAHLFPDGQRALVVRRPHQERFDATWEVWDLNRRSRVTTVRPAVEWLWHPAFAPDGDRIVVSTHKGRDQGDVITLIFIDARSGEAREVDQLPLPANRSRCVLSPVFSADGKQVVYGWWSGDTCLLRAWDVPAAACAWERPVLSPGMPSIHPLPDGRFLLDDTKAAHTIDPASGAAGEDQSPAVQTSIRTVVNRLGLRLVLTADREQRLHVWDRIAGRSRSGDAGWTVGPRTGWDLIPSPDGRTVLIAGPGLRLIDLGTGKAVWGVAPDDGHSGALRQLRFSADGSRLASAADDGTVRVWDVAAGRQLGHWDATGYSAPEPDWTSSNGWGVGLSNDAPMDLSADGRLLVLAGATLAPEPIRLRVIDVATGRWVAARTIPAGPVGAPWKELPGAIAFAPDGTSVCIVYGATDFDNCLTAAQTAAGWEFRADRWQPLGPTDPAPVARTAVGRSAPRRYTYGKGASTWTGRETVELLGAGLGPLALSADDRLIAGVGRSVDDRRQALQRFDIRDLRVWDARSGDVIGTLPWTAPAASTGSGWRALWEPAGASADDLRWTWPRLMALDTTGRLLATADPAGVRLWDVATGHVVHTVPAGPRPPLDWSHGRPAGALAFTPDGSRLAVGMLDGTILFWPVPKPEPVPPRADELDGLWADLVGSDAAKGWRAAWRLEDDPAAAVRLVRVKLKPAEPVAAEEVSRWLADVDAPDFRRREAATRKLEAAIDRVVPAVTAALKAPGTSAEARERLKKVLATAPDDDRPLPAWAAGLSRAVAVLEHSGTPDGPAVLRELVAGAPGAWLTREAQAATDRLRLRHQTPKDGAAK